MKRKLLPMALIFAAGFTTASHAAPEGALDPKFSGDGVASAAFDLSLAPTDRADVQLQGPGGSTFLIGRATIDAIEGSAPSAMAIAKFAPNGQLDTTYGDGGRAFQILPGGDPLPGFEGGAFTPDGKLVVAMTTRLDEGEAAESFVCRFTKFGKLDASFGTFPRTTKGCVRVQRPGEDFNVLTSVAVRADNGIVLGGMWGKTVGLAALSATGKLDPSFGANGFVQIREQTAKISDGIVRDMQLTSDGHVMALANRIQVEANVPGRVLLGKFNAKTGQPAAGFGTAGVKVVGLDTFIDDNQFGKAFDVDADGSIYLVGSVGAGWWDPEFFLVAKLKPSGNIDTHFSGVSPMHWECGEQWCREISDIKASPRGAVVGGTDLGGDNVAMLLTSQNESDVGWSRTYFQTSLVDVKVGLQGDRVVLSGTTQSTGTWDFGAARIDHGKPASFPVVPSAGPNGTIAPAVMVQVGHSNVAEFKVTPKTGFRIASVTGCGNSELIGSRYRTGPITAGCVVKATFEPIPVTP